MYNIYISFFPFSLSSLSSPSLLLHQCGKNRYTIRKPFVELQVCLRIFMSKDSQVSTQGLSGSKVPRMEKTEYAMVFVFFPPLL